MQKRKTPIRCPRCRSTNLWLDEQWIGHTASWEQDETGLISNEGWLEVGDPYKVEGKCRDCGHGWTLRGILQITNVYPGVFVPEWAADREGDDDG